MSQLLAEKIASVRRKHALFAALRGACAMLGVAVLLLAVGMLLDWDIEFPWRVRTAGLGIDLTALTYMFLTYVGAPGDLGAGWGGGGVVGEGGRAEILERVNVFGE